MVIINKFINYLNFLNYFNYFNPIEFLDMELKYI